MQKIIHIQNRIFFVNAVIAFDNYSIIQMSSEHMS